MSANSSQIDDSNGVHAFDPPLSRTIKFWMMLVGVTGSMPCYLFLIRYFLTQRNVRQKHYNHVTIASLFVGLTILSVDLTCHLGFFRLQYIVPSTPAICLIWQLVDYGFWYGDLFLKSWAAIERHVFIFHSNLLSTPWKRLLFHYMPLTWATLYCPLVYVYLVFFYPVDHVYDYTVLVCGGPYYYNGIPPWLIWYESIFHYVVPIFFIVIFSNALFIRVVLQKRQLRVAQGWRQYRKMTLQLLFVSIVYLFDLPYIIVTIVRWSGLPDFGTDVQGPYFYFVNYIPIILYPFAILGTYPKLMQKVFFWRIKRRAMTVYPTIRHAH